MWEVTGIVDGDTFVVSPRWEWKRETGDRVRPIGYNAPEWGKPGSQDAREKLTKILFGRQVELRNPVDIDRGRLVCEVFIDGRNVADFFPEYA